MVRSYSQTWFITKDNVRRTNTREKRQWKTKNYVLGLVIEDGGRQDQLWWTKDVGTRQIKMVSVKMETCHMGRILQQQQQQKRNYLQTLSNLHSNERQQRTVDFSQSHRCRQSELGKLSKYLRRVCLTNSWSVYTLTHTILDNGKWLQHIKCSRMQVRTSKKYIMR